MNSVLLAVTQKRKWWGFCATFRRVDNTVKVIGYFVENRKGSPTQQWKIKTNQGRNQEQWLLSFFF